MIVTVDDRRTSCLSELHGIILEFYNLETLSDSDLPTGAYVAGFLVLVVVAFATRCSIKRRQNAAALAEAYDV